MVVLPQQLAVVASYHCMVVLPQQLAVVAFLSLHGSSSSTTCCGCLSSLHGSSSPTTCCGGLLPLHGSSSTTTCCGGLLSLHGSSSPTTCCGSLLSLDGSSSPTTCCVSLLSLHGSSSPTTCCCSLLSLLWRCMLVVKILSSKIVTKFKISKFFQAKIWWSWKFSAIGQLKAISHAHPTLPGIEWKPLMKHFFPFVLMFLSPPLFPVSFSSSLLFLLLTVTHKIDTNWYEGYHGDQKGMFPITYVELIEEGEIITFLSQWKFCLDVK